MKLIGEQSNTPFVPSQLEMKKIHKIQKRCASLYDRRCEALGSRFESMQIVATDRDESVRPESLGRSSVACGRTR
jgi:hypothetical protein